MRDPDWLVKARKEGRVTERGCGAVVGAPALAPTGIGTTLIGSEVCRLTLVGEPRSKSRPRVVGSHAYTDTKTSAAEESIRTQLLLARVVPDTDHLLAVDLLFRAETGQRRDLDNQIKLVLDACNRFAWHDDFQVTEVSARVERRSNNPGTDLVVRRIGRYTADCKVCGGIIRGNRKENERFCSRDCFDAWQRRNGIELACVGCGLPVYRSPSIGADPGRQPWCQQCRGTRRQRKLCKRGHPLSGDNLLIRADGNRLCRLCNAARAAASRDRGRTKEQ